MDSAEPIAIVGIGCRFPGADGPDEFWHLLANGVDAIREVPPERWNLDELYDADPAATGKMNTRWGGFLSNVDRFDAAFFGISPREAAHVDPQQRLLMEVAWQAMEDAGLPAETLRGQRVGVFIGMASYDYGSLQLQHPEEISNGYANTGSALSIAANRLSYLFDFRGPSVVLDTACSSSLVAAYYACQSLRNGESRVALAGGVNVILSPTVTIGFSKLQAMAPDGRCKAFDARANGYVRGEGAGIVVLKPLTQAVEDGDRIYAVIRGGAVNQDGRTNGLTAPNGLSQEALVREACSNAGIRPSELQYVEAHGTGTPLGDPIELNALGAALASGRPRESRCAVGSVKTNVGHLEAAAGVAGLIKLALSLERRQLPPSLHFEKPNPFIRFDVLPLRVVTRLEPWPAESLPARGGISAFGFGGTNVHLILEERPPRVGHDAARKDDDIHILPISARSHEGLLSLSRAYVGLLNDPENTQPLVDLCATAAVRRDHHEFRLAVVATSRSDMAAKLASFLKGENPRDVESGRKIASRRRKVAFVFPGQGSQWLGMGREMARREPVFAEAIEKCAIAFADHVEWSLIAELAATPEESRLHEVDVIQPAIFAIQVALAELWRSWGIKPDAVVGHSMGEVAAAHIAGALSLEDAARIICRRSRLARRTSGRGAMAVVELSLARSTEILAGYEDSLAVAVNNSPTSTVLSGDTVALEEILVGLERDGVFCRRVNVDYASHSPQMDPLREDLLAMLEGLAPRRTKVPLYSTVTEKVATGTDLGPTYWVRNLREPVLFAGVVEKLLSDGIELFLEISPHPILLPAIQQCLLHLQKDGKALASLRREESERKSLYSTLASLFAVGKPVEWTRLYSPTAEFVPLPTYPWQRERFWFDDQSPASSSAGRSTRKTKNPLIGEHIRSATGSATHLWQRDLSADAFPFLKDCRVRGQIEVSAAACLEMALEAAREALGDEAPFSIDRVQFNSPIRLAEGHGRPVQVVLTQQLSTRFEWQVFAAAGPVDESFSRHAHGQIRIGGVNEERARGEVDLAAIQSRCSAETTGRVHYGRLADLSLDYGASLQGIESVWMGDGEAIGRLKPPPSDARRFQVHPSILDSAMQVLVAAVSGDARSLLLPISVDRFRSDPAFANDAVWVHAVWRTADSRAIGDVRLLTASGTIASEVCGITLAPQSDEALTDAWFYRLTWEKQAIPPRVENNLEGPLVIFADSSGVGDALVGRISAEGGRAIVVTPGAGLHIPERLFEGGPCRIDPARAEHYSALLDAVGQQGIAIDSVVHLWSLDVGESASDAHALGYGSAFLLAQALTQGRMTVSPRLWVGTRGAQPILGEVVAPFQAPVWGLVRTVMHEHPQLLCTAIDLPPAERDIDAEVLFAELIGRLREQQVAYRGGDRFVARLTHVNRGDTEPKPRVSPDDSAAINPFSAQLLTPGDLSSLSFVQVARRRPAFGEVEIEVVAAGLNFHDILLALGLLPDQKPLFGVECAGRITALGDGVTEWSIGDEVVALAQPSLSSVVRTPISLIARKPSRLDFEEAAAIPIAFLAAHYALNHLARLQAGERVLIHSATGAVGLACLRLARDAGADVYATAGTVEKRRLLESLGVRRAMDSRSLSFADEVLEATDGQGVDVVVNSLPGEAMARGLAILRPAGRFIELGKRDAFEGGQLPLRALEDSRSFFLVDLGSLAAKRPEFCGMLFRQTLREFEEKDRAPLPMRVFAAKDLGEAFQHMARSRHIGKVVIRMDPAGVKLEPGDASALIRDDAAYLVTGGLGRMGLAIGAWLIEKGASTLILADCVEPSLEARAAIQAMESAGARVIVERLDATDRAAVDACFATWARDVRPLRGIVHAASLSDDGSLVEQTSERFDRTVAHKMNGAWNLHRASLACAIDLFVLCSSVASVLGATGRSGSAAGNQFLDGLAHYRRAQGLPAISINWAPWPDAAMRGVRSLSSRAVGETLDRLLRADVPQIAVMNVDWQEWRASTPVVAKMPGFSRLNGAEVETIETQDLTRKQVLAMPPAERVTILADYLRDQAAGVLRLASAKIDLDAPLVALGIDSLMGIELKSRLERKLGVTIPLLQLIKGASLSELAHTLAGDISGSAPAASDKVRSTTVGPARGER